MTLLYDSTTNSKLEGTEGHAESLVPTLGGPIVAPQCHRERCEALRGPHIKALGKGTRLITDHLTIILPVTLSPRPYI